MKHGLQRDPEPTLRGLLKGFLALLGHEFLGARQLGGQGVAF